MQVIRLSRTGRHKYPLYRIVTADKRRAATGNYIDVLGHYNPHTKELVIRKEELTTAISHGAQPSNAVLKLMQKDGIELPKWASIETRDRKPRKAEEPAAEKADVVEDEAKTEATDEKAEAKPAGDDEVATEAAAAAEVTEPEKTDDGTPTETADAKAAKETTEAVADAAIDAATADEK